MSEPWWISYRSKDNLRSQSSLRTLSVTEGKWRRSVMPGNQSEFNIWPTFGPTFPVLNPLKLDVFSCVSRHSEFTSNPKLKLQHMVQISTREGTSVCLFCSWHLLLLTYVGSCPALISFSKRIAKWQAHCDESSKCNFCPAKKRKTIKHSTVYILLAARSLC